MALIRPHPRRGGVSSPAPVTAVAFYSVVAAAPLIGSEANWPAAVYDATAGKTYVAFERIVNRQRSVASVVSYDHSGSAWSTVYDIAPWTLEDDIHGQPVLVIDADGYVWCFYGQHVTPQTWARSSSVNDVSGWVQQSALTGNVSYPKPVMVGSVLHLFHRSDAVLTRRTLVHRSGTPSSGSLTFSAAQTLIDLGADTRFYGSAAHNRSGKIHIAFTKSDGADTLREHIYYAVFNPSTNAIENFAGSVVAASGDLPADLTEANASLRLVEHTGGDRTSHVLLQFDTSGNPHLLYAEGSGSTYTLIHRWHNGSSWQENDLGVTITDDDSGTGYVRHYGLVPGASGTMQAWYTQEFVSTEWLGGYEMWRKTWSGSAWGAAQRMGEAGTYAFDAPQGVQGATANARTIYATTIDGNEYDNAAAMGLYVHGDGGYLAGSPPGVQYPVGNDVVHLAVADDGTVQDLAWGFWDQLTQNAITVSGSEIVFNGTTSRITFPDSALWSLSGDFTFVMEVEYDTTSGTVTLFEHGDYSGTTSWQAWRLFHNGSGYFFQTDDGSGLATRLSHALARSTGVTTTIALERSGTTLRLFINDLTAGNAVASATWSGTPQDVALQVTVGAEYKTNEASDYRQWLDGSVMLWRLVHEAEISG